MNVAREFVAEANARPLDPDTFLDLYRVATDALAGRRREIPPDAELCWEERQPGIRLTDVPMNQMGLSVIRECKRRFPVDVAELRFWSFMFRWMAIDRALENGRLNVFTRQNDDGEMEVHAAVLRVAASCPLTDEVEFDDTFEDCVRAIVDDDD